MDITDDVEGPVLLASVDPERLAFNRRRVDRVLGVQREDVSKAFALQEAQ